MNMHQLPLRACNDVPWSSAEASPPAPAYVPRVSPTVLHSPLRRVARVFGYIGAAAAFYAVSLVVFAFATGLVEF